MNTTSLAFSLTVVVTIMIVTRYMLLQSGRQAKNGGVLACFVPVQLPLSSGDTYGLLPTFSAIRPLKFRERASQLPSITAASGPFIHLYPSHAQLRQWKVKFRHINGKTHTGRPLSHNAKRDKTR